MKLMFIIIGIYLASTFHCSYYDHGFPYDFEKADNQIVLEAELDEISGLSYAEGNKLYAVQDEKGVIYQIDWTNKKSKAIVEFKKSGDFEGIIKTGQNFYVLESDGDIFKVDKSGEYQKYDFIEKDNDYEFEGICLHPDGKRLLIVCKNHSKKKENAYLWIYAFDISANQYEKEAFLKIAKDNFHDKFKASGISISDQNNLVVLSASTNSIIELDLQGKLLNKAQLPFITYPQAEGICFSPDGDLIIASEKNEFLYAKIIRLEKNEE